MKLLIEDIKTCKICLPYLPYGANPIIAAAPKSKVAIVGQAPGSIVHKSGIPWDDKSGDRLRQWLDVDKPTFYNANNFAIIPMGFCYPGKGKSGDLPPRPECAPKWHNEIFKNLTNLELVVLIGTYAQSYYLGSKVKKTLTETVKSYNEYLPKFLPLPHPSPRNNIWLRRNSWFTEELVPVLKKKIKNIC